MPAMRKLALLTFCIAALAVACGPGEPDPVDAGEATGKSPAEVQANFTRVRQLQEDVLKATADLVARAESASVEELEAGMKQLNGALLQGRQEFDYMRTLGTEEGKSRGKELRKASRLIQRAYAKLVEHHPDPSPNFMRMGDEPTQ
jgi:hypothetical protein